MPESLSPEFLDLRKALAGRYSLERELGRGGMGIVFLAREVALDRLVALKLLPPELAARREVRERFLQEARTAAKLSHPNIVPIFAVDEVDGYVFYAMAYIEGETLGERVRSRGPLSATEATRLVREVAWALAYAHLQDVVHRDVKPDNILLERDTGRALVSDFGIAMVGVDVEEGEPDRVMGTAEFMSPEQARGAPVDARSDLYSLGVVGFYAVSGRVPFEGPSAAAILGKHVSEPPPPLASKAPGVTAPLAGVVDRCLRKDPERRFADGGAVADALAEETAVDRALPVPLRVFIKRLRGSSQASGGAAVLLLMFGAPGIIQALVQSPGLGITALVMLVVALMGVYGGHLAYLARKVLKAGYTLEEARLALSQDVARRNEEFRFEVGPRKTFYDTVLERLMLTGFGVGAASALGLLLLPSAPGWLVAGAALGGLGGALMGLLRTSRARRRADIVGEQWLRIVGGRPGDWVFKLGGVGLGSSVRALEPGGYRPTEMAIGLAASQLYAELPKETRRSLPGLPETVRKLEGDARVLRSEVKELNAVLAEIGDDPAAPGAEERARVHDEVRATRDEAESRLRKAVAALETIRLGLLRMHAGEGAVHSVTMELEAAKGLSADMSNLLEGHREVERLLAQRRATGTFTLPAASPGEAEGPGDSGDPR